MPMLGHPVMAHHQEVYDANVRPSFFGGVVSTRLKCANIVGAIAPKPAQAKATKQRPIKAIGAGRSVDSKTKTPAPKSATLAPNAPKLLNKAALAERRQAEALKRQVQLDQLRLSSEEAMKAGTSAALPRPAIIAARPSVKHQPPERRVMETKHRAPDVRVTATGHRIVTQRARTPPPPSASRAHQVQSAPLAALSGKRAYGWPAAPKKGAAASSAAKLRSLAPVALEAAVSNRGKRCGALPAPEQVRAGVSKQCRRCQKTMPLGKFFVDKRLEDGVMHTCAGCTVHNGLSGRLPTDSELATLRAAAPSTAGAPSATLRSPGRIGNPPQKQLQSLRGGALAPSAPSAPFYSQSAAAPAVAAVRAGAHAKRVRQHSMLDHYEDDFVESDDDAAAGGEDWRAELASVTRGFYREDRRDDGFDDRAMVASAADMRREEARSRRLGRTEDAAAEREEAAHAAAKEAKLGRARKRARAARGARKRRVGARGAAFLDDGGDEDDGDMELSD